jgi:hypothetical protein
VPDELAVLRGHRRTTWRAALLGAVLAFALVACGGNTASPAGGSTPATATFAPASTAFFVSIKSDPNGEQWQLASALLDKFPSRDKLINEVEKSMRQEGVDFERDVKPALGPEVGIAGLELSENPAAVFFTRSPQPDKLEALLKKGDDPPVTRQIDGWLVGADKAADIDRFDSARKSGTLADESEFQDALDSVDSDGGVVAFISGDAIQKAIDRSLTQEGAPPGLTKGFGQLRSVAASASAEGPGVRLDALVKQTKEFGLEPYSPALDDVLPAKPIFFFSAAHLDEAVRKGLEAVQNAVPNFAQQRAQVEQALGFSIDDDVLPLLKKEIAVGVYGEATGGLPVTVDVVLRVDDEDKARRLMERVGALLELGGTGKAMKVQVGDVQATKLTFTDGSFSVLWVVDDGKLEVSTSREGLEKLRASSARLADDDTYNAAREAGKVPDKVSALIYSDLSAGIPFFTSLPDSGADAETRANLQHLRSAILSETEDGTNIDISGFLTIS